jgi:hypothetical protein
MAMRPTSRRLWAEYIASRRMVPAFVVVLLGFAVAVPLDMTHTHMAAWLNVILFPAIWLVSYTLTWWLLYGRHLDAP